MFKPIIAALIAATALVPPVLAQDRGGRGEGRWGGARQESRQVPSQPRQNWGNQNSQRQQWNGGNRGGGERRQWNGSQNGNQGQRWSGNRGQAQAPAATPAPRPAQAAPAPQRPQQGWTGNRNGNREGTGQGWNGNRDGNRGQGWNGNRDGNRDGDRRNWNGNRTQGGQQFGGNRRPDSGWNGNRQQQRPGFYGRPGTNDSRWRGNDRSRWNGNDRGRWNSRWRNDNRYNWRDYRARNRNLYRLPRYYAPSSWHYGYRRFSIGYTLSTMLFAQQYWISDPWAYRLPEVYGPYRWVRYYNDALLVDTYSGQVVDVIYDIFW